MTTFKSRLSAGLMALALSSAALMTAGPAMADRFHRPGAWGYHHKWHHYGWGPRWDYGYYPAYYRRCFLKKKFSPYHGVFIKKVCF